MFFHSFCALPSIKTSKTNPLICASKVTIAFLRREKRKHPANKMWLDMVNWNYSHGLGLPSENPSQKHQIHFFMSHDCLTDGASISCVHPIHNHSHCENLETETQTIREARLFPNFSARSGFVMNVVKNPTSLSSKKPWNLWYQSKDLVSCCRTKRRIQVTLVHAKCDPKPPTYFVCPPSHLYDGPFL